MHSVGLVGKEGKALRVVRGENEGEGGVRVFSSQAMLRKNGAKPMRLVIRRWSWMVVSE